MRRAPIGISIVLGLATVGGLFGPPALAKPDPGGARPFQGTWSASGRRFTLPTEGNARAGVVQVSGAIVLESGEGLGRGFLGEAVGYDDGEGLSVGRAVWTDENGDRIFSTLRGQQIETGRRAVGTFTGGTGRYAGLTGEYVFEWRYVVDVEDGEMHALAVRLEGKAGFPGPPR